MIDKEELAQIMKFVSEYWVKLNNDPDNYALNILPSKFWMKSLGGPVGNEKTTKGRWVTTLMYLEDEEMEKSFREVLARWHAKGQQTATDLPTKSPDLNQLGRR